MSDPSNQKIYTRTGDGGACALADGQRSSKASMRVNCYGELDELNACIGVLRAFLIKESLITQKVRDSSNMWLEAIQNDLFILGTDFATPYESPIREKIESVGEREITVLENLIDFCSIEIPPLTRFVLPGGSQLNALSHLARTICRRVERRAVELSQTEQLGSHVIPYLNRLSDFLFAFGRYISHKENAPEIFRDATKNTRTLVIRD